jgi:hypothetical protein
MFAQADGPKHIFAVLLLIIILLVRQLETRVIFTATFKKTICINTIDLLVHILSSFYARFGVLLASEHFLLVANLEKMFMHFLFESWLSAAQKGKDKIRAKEEYS